MSYRKHHVKNKIHQIRPKKRFYKKPFFWAVVLVLILLASGIYIFLFFPGLQVKNVVVSGNEKISAEDLQNMASTGINRKIIGVGNWGIFSKTIFLVDATSINRQILDGFPIIESVQITKKYPESIILGITERKPAGIFCEGTENRNCFLIDINGVAFEPAPQINQNFFIIRSTISEKEVFVGEKAIEANIINAISKIEKNLKDNFQINVTEALILDPSRVDIKTSENWNVYFDLNSDINLEIIKLDSLLKNDIMQENRPNLQYIDLRFKDKAYYK